MEKNILQETTIRSIWHHTKGKTTRFAEKVLFITTMHHLNEWQIATAKISDLTYEMFPYPLYSPVLVPSNHYFFHNMKIWLQTKKNIE